MDYPNPDKSNQGMECGCRVYFDGAYKVHYCRAHADVLAELKAVKEWMEDSLIDRQQKGLPSRKRYDAVCAALTAIGE